MPRRNRCFAANVPFHITQRGVDRCTTFRGDSDRGRYLGLLQEYLEETGVRLLGWCLMSNHVHLVAVPSSGDGLSVLLRRVHGRYAQYFNVIERRTGHLWQNRFFACALGPAHLSAALAYVERNPVRANLVARASDYPWSSAPAHLGGGDRYGILDMQWWARHAPGDWARALGEAGEHDVQQLRQCTHAGRPFGDDAFVHALGQRFGRKWTPGRPKKQPETAATSDDAQLPLFPKPGA